MERAWHPYEPVIGLEVHVRLDLKTKIFCDDPYIYGQDPNTLISEISLGYPGSLPKVNKKAIEFALKMGMACNSKIASEITFDRKNYFYPDLPKGYQLTQDRNPICREGTVRIRSGNEIRSIKLIKIHLEEDAGKSIHDQGSHETHIDFNRAGTALIEIVTQPELSTPEEAYAFMYEIRRIVRALGISDGNMEEGSLRCDANVSVKEIGSTELGVKVEIKNVNSFNNVKHAIGQEILRQISRLQAGKEIISESRTFNPLTGESHGMRTKETLTDYRYFPDPDLTPVIANLEWIDSLKNEIKELPFEKELRYQAEFSLSETDVAVLTESNGISDFFEKTVELSSNPKASANWIMGPVKSILNERGIGIEDFPVSPKILAKLISLVDEGTISQNLASKQLFPALISHPEKDIESILEELVHSEKDAYNLDEIIKSILERHPQEAEMLKNGKKKLIGMFMGQIMKATGGKADPQKARDVLMRSLDI